MKMIRLTAIATLLLFAGFAFGDGQVWEWTQSAPGNANYSTGGNWAGGTAPENQGTGEFIDNKDVFVFTNALDAIQSVNLESAEYFFGWQFGSIVLDRFHRLRSPKGAKVTISDASRMEGFVRTCSGNQSSGSSAGQGPVLKVGQGVTNRLAQMMIQDYAWPRRRGDNVGGVAEFGKSFGVGTFRIGDESSEVYKNQGSSYLFDAFESGVQGHLIAGQLAPVTIKGHATDEIIASGAYLHLDASAAGTVGDDFTWRDANGGSVTADPVGAPTWGASVNGLPTIDLEKGSAFELSEDITGVREVFLVFRDLDPGMNKLPPPLLGDYTGVGNFARNTNKDYEYLFASGTAATKWMDAGEVWYDGSRVLPDFCGSFGGQFHVVSVMLYGGTGVVGCLGAAVKNAASDKCGQVAFAEVLVYKRMLTDAERRATNRYLRQKWQSADLAYDWDLGSYTVVNSSDGSGKITFEAGTTGIRELRLPKAEASFVKRGEGRLEVGRLANTGISVDVKEGSLAIVRPEAPVVCEMASDPIAWFDPSDERTDGSLTPDPDDETRVSQMVDYRKTNNRTGLLPTAKNTKNWNVNGISPLRVADTPTGLKALDFGAAATSAATFEGKSSRMAITGNPIMREGFVVWKKNANVCGAPFSDGTWNFFGVSSSKIVDSSYCMAAVCGGYWTVNGEAVSGPSVSLPKDEYMVVALRPSAGCMCSYLGSQRSSEDTNGGCSYGELILYDRILTPAERRNTEAYLMKKWLNKDHPMAESAKMTVPTYTIAAGAVNAIETDADMTIGKLSSKASGPFVKAGSGALVTDTLPDGTTVLDVQGGSLSSSVAVVRNPVLHLDASVASSLTTVTDESGDERVTEWRDVRGNGICLEPAEANISGNRPWLKTATIGGASRNYVSLGQLCARPKGTEYDEVNSLATNTAAAMVIMKDGVKTTLSGLREYHFVLADSPQGNVYQTLVTITTSVFTRNGNSTYFKLSDTDHRTDAILHGINGLDGKSKGYGEGSYSVSSGYHQFVMATTNGTDTTSLAYIGYCKDFNSKHLVGGQKICELIAYDRVLSESERQNVVNYLRKKWLGVTDGATMAFDSIAVASGSSVALDLAGWSSVSAAKLSGGGSVGLGAPIAGLAEIEGVIGADGVAQPMTVSGTVTLAETGVVKVVCPNVRIKAGFYPLFSATSLTNPEALAGWTLELSRSIGKPTSLEVRNGQIGLNVKPLGLMIIVD